MLLCFSAVNPSILPLQPRFRFPLLWKKDENVNDTTTDNNKNNGNAARKGRHGGELPMVVAVHERAAVRSTPDPRKAELERLGEAMSRMMLDYNRARREVLYGLDDLGRPLEAQGDGESEIDGQVFPRHGLMKGENGAKGVPLELQGFPVTIFDTEHLK